MTEFTDDPLLDGRVIVRQPARGYRAAIDPVLLAAAARAESGMRVLDAGCGTGAAMFCLASRVPGLSLAGVEVQPLLAGFARDGVILNKLEGQARVFEGSITEPPPDFLASFDVVITNPPYGAGGTPPPDPSLATAHMEGEVDLVQWLAVCMALAKPKGRVVVIHRAERLSEILAILRTSCGDIRVRPIHPKVNEPARRVIVDAGKERKTRDTILPGFVLHETDGSFTAAANAILRGGEGFSTP